MTFAGGDVTFLGGPDGDLLIGSTGATAHVFDLLTGGAVVIKHLAVELSDASGGPPIVPLFSIDLGQNDNWFFGTPMLVFSQPPLDTPLGELLPPIELSIQDALGNVLPDYNGDVTIALEDNATGAILELSLIAI